jgi:pimeloyl-ACP methyl ester carboxylesterase
MKNITPMDDLKSICAAGTDFKEEMIATNEQVTLRVITFYGPAKRNKPDIVFVAGWVSLIEGWKEILSELTREYRVYYIETREKISSQIKGRVKFDVDSVGNDVVEIIDYFGLKNNQYLLLGSSLGATAILDCYHKIPQKPKCLVLIGPNAEFRVPLTWRIIVKSFYPGLYKLIKPSVKWYLRTFRLNIDTDYEQYEKYSRALDAGDPWKLRPAVLALAKYQVWDILSTVTCPTLLIGASKDKLHEPENLKRIVEMMPNAHSVDMETNKQTHSKPMIKHLDKFLDNL